MFTVRKHMFMGFELMFIVRELNFSSSKDTFSADSAKSFRAFVWVISNIS